MKPINSEYLEHKDNRIALFRSMLASNEVSPPVDTRKYFDKEVDTDLLRETFFKEGCAHLEHALPIKFKTAQLIIDEKTAYELRLESAKGFKYHTNLDIHSYHKIVHFSNEFFLEINGYNCIGRDPEGKPMELDSFLVLHLVDPETQRKLFIGNVINHISEHNKMRDCIVKLDHTLWTLLSDSFKVRKGVQIVIGDTFTNLQGTLLKPFPKVKVTILTYKLNTVKGAKKYIVDFTNDALTISKHTPNVLQIYDYKVTMFA